MQRKEDIVTAAGQEIARISENINKVQKKQRWYRIFLYTVLILSCITITIVGLYNLDNRIPSTIYMKAGQSQSLHLGIPAVGDIVPADIGFESNIPGNKLQLDLSTPVTMNAEQLNEYLMEVKLFGILPIKRVNIQIVEEKELIPIGKPVGIYLKTTGILVIGIGEFTDQAGETQAPARNILKTGDYILGFNGREVSSKDELMQAILETEGENFTLQFRRGEKVLQRTLCARQNENGEYKIGIWVRDNAQGIGTMTFMDAEGNFGALGHGISDVDTSLLMESFKGKLYETDIVNIKRGRNGAPGEMTGVIVYSQDHLLGEINENSVRGVYGQLNSKGMRLAEEKAIPIAYKQEIKKGPAKILCTLENKPEYFEIEITGVNLNHDNVNRGIELKVTDEELLSRTGGIIQGMSGAPIIQDGKLIGAVTHVLIADSKRGYGIFIEHMLQE